MLDPGLDDLFQRAAATKARLRADVSAQAIGLDWQRRTGCGINETYDPPQCVTSKPALIPRRSSIIFLVTTRGDGKRELLSSTLVSATVDFREASGAAVWSKCQCLQPPTANQKPARLLRAAFMGSRGEPRGLPSWPSPRTRSAVCPQSPMWPPLTHAGSVLRHHGPVSPVQLAPAGLASGWRVSGLPNNPRPFVWRGRSLLTIGVECEDRSKQCKTKALVMVSDLDRNESMLLVPPSNSTRPRDPTRYMDAKCSILHDEKNWSPLVLGREGTEQQLLFVYQHAPLQVVRLPTADGSLHGSKPVWAYQAPPGAHSSAACRDVRGGSAYLHWRGPYHVALGHVQCGVLTERGCNMAQWDSEARHCAAHQRTPREWAHTCSRAYRTVLTVLDTARWQLSCSPRLTFTPPPFWQCTQGWRGKWDVQYVHSLERAPDGKSMLVGMEFENRCPAMSRIGMADFGLLVDATLADALEPDVESDEPPINVSKQVSRWAF